MIPLAFSELLAKKIHGPIDIQKFEGEFVFHNIHLKSKFLKRNFLAKSTLIITLNITISTAMEIVTNGNCNL